MAAEGAAALTARRLATAVGCDPAALYRHFATMDELRRQVGDRLLAGVRTTGLDTLPWDEAVRRLCLALRRTLLAHPQLAGLVQGAPTRLPNEVRISEALLACLLRVGLSPRDAAESYHVLIEFTIGSATIDAGLAVHGRRAATAAYRAWRAAYTELDPARYPALAATAEHLYRGSADDRFERALGVLLAALATPGRPHRPTVLVERRGLNSG